MDMQMVENCFRQKRYQQVDSGESVLKLWRALFIEDVPSFKDTGEGDPGEWSGRGYKHIPERLELYQSRIDTLRKEGYRVTWIENAAPGTKQHNYTMSISLVISDVEVFIDVSSMVDDSMFAQYYKPGDTLKRYEIAI